MKAAEIYGECSIQVKNEKCIKIAVAQEAKIINIYRNTRLKLLKANVAIWYNKTCRSNKQHD
jgi:hypothetical protein